MKRMQRISGLAKKIRGRACGTVADFTGEYRMESDGVLNGDGVFLLLHGEPGVDA